MKSANPYLSEYRLPRPVTIAGHGTRAIVFSANAIMAVLDDPDAAKIGAAEGVSNQAAAAALTLGLTPEQARLVPRTGKFLGEKVVLERRDRDEGLHMTFVTRITRTVSTVTSHPGKTLIGCSYAIETVEDDVE